MLNDTCKVCMLHDNVLSIVNPRNLVDRAMGINLLLEPVFMSIDGLFLVLKWIKRVFSKLNEITVFKPIVYSFKDCMSIWIKFGDVRVKSIRVLSANKTGVDLLFTCTNWSKSFMYKRDSKGPRMEPCGTPGLINVQSDRAL